MKINEEYKNINFQKLTTDLFKDEKDKVFNLIENIWTRNLKDSEEAKGSVSRYFETDGTGTYFLLNNDRDNIGITGYYVIDSEKGIFGLRHHGIIEEYRGKGYGSDLLKELVDKIKNDGFEEIKGIVELVPKGASDIEKSFIKMGFNECTNEFSIYPGIKKHLEEGYYEKVYVLNK